MLMVLKEKLALAFLALTCSILKVNELGLFEGVEEGSENRVPEPEAASRKLHT